MRVYRDDDGEKRWIGTAEVPLDAGPVYSVRLFGVASIITEDFVVGVVTELPTNAAVAVVHRAVIIAPGQLAEVLPGWRALDG